MQPPSNEPEVRQSSEEIMAEAMVYSNIYGQCQQQLMAAPECRTRARAAMEDFRESRLTHTLRNRGDTRQ